MTRRGWHWLVVFLLVAEAAVWALGNRVVNRGDTGSSVALVFDEGFEGPGYENVWTETDSNEIIDDASTVQVQSGTYSWFLDGSGNTGEPDTDAYHDPGSAWADPHYFRAYIYLSSATPNVDEFFIVVNGSTSAGSSLAYRFTIGNVSSTGTIVAFAFGGGTPSATISFDTWVRLEGEYDSSTGVLNWRVDGVDQTPSSGSTGRTARYVHLFSTELAEGYVDGVAISEEGWIGTQ